MSSQATPRKKWYVVWHGRSPGIYTSWDDCNRQVKGFAGALYKAFPSPGAAVMAFRQGAPSKSDRGQVTRIPPTYDRSEVVLPSWSVDAACDATTGVMEYQGVVTDTGEQLFHKGPFEGASNNIGEFLAIVHALSLMKKSGVAVPIYTDSRTALSWVKNRKIKTTIQRTKLNDEVFTLMERALAWISSNGVQVSLLKWETKRWGENPADFGRK